MGNSGNSPEKSSKPDPSTVEDIDDTILLGENCVDLVGSVSNIRLSEVPSQSPLRRCRGFSLRVSLGKFRHDIYSADAASAGQRVVCAFESDPKTKNEENFRNKTSPFMFRDQDPTMKLHGETDSCTLRLKVPKSLLDQYYLRVTVLPPCGSMSTDFDRKHVFGCILPIPLSSVIRGPTQHNHKLCPPSKKNTQWSDEKWDAKWLKRPPIARVSFECVLEQRTAWHLRPLNVAATLNQDNPSYPVVECTEYSMDFSLCIPPSGPEYVRSGDWIRAKVLPRVKISPRGEEGTHTNKTVEDSSLEWGEGAWGPGVSHRTTYLDAANLSVAFSLFCRKKDENIAASVSSSARVLYAQHTIPLERLLANAVVEEPGTAIESTDSPQRVASFDQELFLNGNKRGRVSGRIVLSGLPQVIHAIGGVHSERGLCAGTHAPSTPTKHATRRAKALMRVLNKFQKTVAKTRSTAYTDEEVILGIISELKSFFVRFSSSGSPSPNYLDGKYESEANRRVMQKIFLQILGTFLHSLSARTSLNIQNELSELIWILLMRQELSFQSCFGFESWMEMEEGEDADEIGEASAVIANEYRELLVQAFNKVIKGLEMHVNNIAGRRRFQARVLVLAFFRLNEFERCSNSLISALVSEEMEAESIPECRDLEFGLESIDVAERHSSATLVTMPLEETSSTTTDQKKRDKERRRKQSANRDLSDFFRWKQFNLFLNHKFGCPVILKHERWLVRLKQHTELFLLFGEAYMEHAVQVMAMAKVSNMRTPWHVIPGYKAVLKAGLLEMKRRGFSAKDWPQSLVRFSSSLLLSEDNLMVFTRIMLNKTSLHNVMAVSRSCDLLKIWMSSLQTHYCSHLGTVKLSPELPLKFDFAFFLKAVDLLLGCSENKHCHHIILCKAIDMLYNGWEAFTEAQANQIRELFKTPTPRTNKTSKENFSPAENERYPNAIVRLFLHWSHHVRNLFHYLFLFRLLLPKRVYLRSRLLGGQSTSDSSVDNNPKNSKSGQQAIESKGKTRTCTEPDTICSVFASVFTITEFALQYNVPNDVIGADAEDRTKVQLLAATPSTPPRSAPIALPSQPHISVHRRLSCPYINLPQKPACPGFKALTAYFGCLHPSWRKFESEHKDDWKKLDGMLRPRAIDIIRSCRELGDVIAEHEEVVKQLYNAVESVAVETPEKSIQGTDTHHVRIPPVNFPGFTLDTDGHIRGGECEQSDTW